MMLIAATVASVLVASTLLAAAPSTSASLPGVPPLTIHVTAADDVAPSLIARVLAEADAIWRPAGVTFIWRRESRVAVPYARVSETGPAAPNTLRVRIGGDRGAARDGRAPLGWIVFDDERLPSQEIYVSHANAVAMLQDSGGVVGVVDQMPSSQRDTLLGRALGRALAHELGHYLLASKIHTPKGLMKAVLTASEMFLPDTGGFRIEPAQRLTVAARLSAEPQVASR